MKEQVGRDVDLLDVKNLRLKLDEEEDTDRS
jgi:hypothetical protein